MAPDSLMLPAGVVSPTDVNRLRRELQQLQDFLHQAALRGGGTAVKLPRTSRLLDELAAANKLNLLLAADCSNLLAFLQALQKAPVITISFAADPSAAFTIKIVTWLRQNIHPQLLLRVGLQPGIAAGCAVRTNNHYYDFSLRRRFDEQRGLLIEKLQASGAAHER